MNLGAAVTFPLFGSSFGLQLRDLKVSTLLSSSRNTQTHCQDAGPPWLFPGSAAPQPNTPSQEIQVERVFLLRAVLKKKKEKKEKKSLIFMNGFFSCPGRRSELNVKFSTLPPLTANRRPRVRNWNLKTRRLNRALFSTNWPYLEVPSALGFECLLTMCRPLPGT